MPLTLDPQIAQALKPAAGPAPAVGDWKSRRAAADGEFADLNALRATPTDVTTTDHWVQSADGGSVLLRWFSKDDETTAGPGPAILYLHGGAMILGSVEAYDAIIKTYVSASGVPALAVDYRLAPENPHPGPVEDCYTGLIWLAGHTAELGVDPARIAVMGDSAGGALAAGVTLLARDRNGPSIALQILLYPMLDDRRTPQDPRLAELATFTYDDDATGWGALLGDAAGGEDVPAYAAPARAADLAGLPPLYLDVGQVDILCAQDLDYARRISAEDTPVELHVHPGATHTFELRAPDADVSRRAMTDRLRVLGTL